MRNEAEASSSASKSVSGRGGVAKTSAAQDRTEEEMGDIALVAPV